MESWRLRSPADILCSVSAWPLTCWEIRHVLVGEQKEKEIGCRSRNSVLCSKSQECDGCSGGAIVHQRSCATSRLGIKPVIWMCRLSALMNWDLAANWFNNIVIMSYRLPERSSLKSVISGYFEGRKTKWLCGTAITHLYDCIYGQYIQSLPI